MRKCDWDHRQQEEGERPRQKKSKTSWAGEVVHPRSGRKPQEEESKGRVVLDETESRSSRILIWARDMMMEGAISFPLSKTYFVSMWRTSCLEGRKMLGRHYQFSYQTSAEI